MEEELNKPIEQSKDFIDMAIKNFGLAGESVKECESLYITLPEQIDCLRKNRSKLSHLQTSLIQKASELSIKKNRLERNNKEYQYLNDLIEAYYKTISLLAKDVEYLENKLIEKLRLIQDDMQKYQMRKETEKIQWYGTEYQFIKLIDILIEKGYLNIDEKKKYVIISQHFKNKKGKQFKPSQMSVVATTKFLII